MKGREGMDPARVALDGPRGLLLEREVLDEATPQLPAWGKAQDTPGSCRRVRDRARPWRAELSWVWMRPSICMTYLSWVRSLRSEPPPHVDLGEAPRAAASFNHRLQATAVGAVVPGQAARSAVPEPGRSPKSTRSHCRQASGILGA